MQIHIPSTACDIWEFVTQDTEKSPLSLLTSVTITQVNVRENILAFHRDQENCPIYTGVCINQVSAPLHY